METYVNKKLIFTRQTFKFLCNVNFNHDLNTCINILQNKVTNNFLKSFFNKIYFMQLNDLKY